MAAEVPCQRRNSRCCKEGMEITLKKVNEGEGKKKQEMQGKLMIWGRGDRG